MGRAIAITPDESAALSASTGRFLRRNLQSIIGVSEAMIPAGAFPGPNEVHDIRVNMKRGRAILKLLRDSPGTDFYRRENAALRDISSLFSHSREADVLKKTLRMLVKRDPHLFTPEIVRKITREAELQFHSKAGIFPTSNAVKSGGVPQPTEQYSAEIAGMDITSPESGITSKGAIEHAGARSVGYGSGRVTPDEVHRSHITDQPAKLALADTARELLRRAWYRIGFVNLSGVTRETLFDGLWSSFNRASAALAATRKTSLPEDAHELRKRSKDLLYQVRFFSDYNPGHFEKVYSQLNDICSVLGKCNDLAVAGTIVRDYQIKTADKQMLKVIETIEREKNEMLEKIFHPAGDLFETFYSGS